MGRDINATRPVHVRLTPDQFAAIEEIRKAEDRKQGDVIRSLIADALRRRQRRRP